jgi:hypothetical protein
LTIKLARHVAHTGARGQARRFHRQDNWRRALEQNLRLVPIRSGQVASLFSFQRARTPIPSEPRPNSSGQ